MSVGDYTIWPGGPEQWGWQERANCSGSDVLTWLSFVQPPRGRGAAEALAERLNERYCASCPVIRQCKAWADSDRWFFGIAAGIVYSEEATKSRGHKNQHVSKPQP